MENNFSYMKTMHGVIPTLNYINKKLRMSYLYLCLNDGLQYPFFKLMRFYDKQNIQTYVRNRQMYVH